MNDIANDTLNARFWKLTVGQCLDRVLTYYFTVTSGVRNYIDGGSVRLVSYGIYWSGRFEGDYYVVISVGYEFVFNVLSRNGTRVGVIIADVQYRNGSVIMSVRLMPRMRVSTLDSAKYTVEGHHSLTGLVRMAELASISPGYVLVYDVVFYDNNLGE
ncbi:hypothetical protein [Vulcanisaeta sp. JCM 14467]